MPKRFILAPASRFFCTNCGREGIPVARKKGQERKSGHLKKLYCIYCDKEVNHVEIKLAGDYSYEDFLEEFEAGRFRDGNRDSIEDLLGCSKGECPFNKNGKCWNANNSAECPHKPIVKEE